MATEQEAADTKVEQLWVGDNPQLADELLNALADAQIPFRSREVLRSSPWPWFSILFWRFAKPKPVSEYHVDIFERDADRAHAILQKIAVVDPLEE